MEIQVIGMSWYRPDTFARLRAMFEDGNKLHKTYGEWLAAAEKGRKSMESKGVRVICVDIDPDAFPKWCITNGMKLNAEARNKYGSLVAYKAAISPEGGDASH